MNKAFLYVPFFLKNTVKETLIKAIFKNKNLKCVSLIKTGSKKPVLRVEKQAKTPFFASRRVFWRQRAFLINLSRINQCFLKFFLLFCVLQLSACATKHPVLPENRDHVVKDLRKIPQSPYVFLDNGKNKKIFVLQTVFSSSNASNYLISEEKSREEFKTFRNRFFSAWKAKQPHKGNIEYFQSILNVSYERRGYAENLQKWTDNHFAQLKDNAQYQNAPSMAKNAIIVNKTALRTAPTHKPYFTQPKKPGQAYPFDMFQNSSLALGVPVKVFHVSKDGLWYYVECSSASGWISTSDVAFVDEAFMKKWQENSYIAFVKDNISLVNSDVRTRASLGSLLPFEKPSSAFMQKNYHVLVPFKGKNDKADITVFKFSHKSFDTLVEMPIPLTQENIAVLTEPLMGDLYGWGGMYENRDCSSTLQDLFTPFGLWLPRNSGAQRQIGEVISLKDLNDREKEKIIAENAIPFQTLIYLPGHIGLYVGKYRKKALMLHNIWGVRLKEDQRLVIGKTIISTLYIGMENKNAVQSLMSRVQSINILGK